MTNAHEQLKLEFNRLRMLMDGISKLVYLTPEAKTRVQMAKAWLGKAKGAITGEASPYLNDGKRKEAKDIEPTADAVPYLKTYLRRTEGGSHTSFLFSDEPGNHYIGMVETVDQARQMLENLSEEIVGMKETPLAHYSWKASVALTNVYTELQNAKIICGLHLGSIRQSQSSYYEPNSGNVILDNIKHGEARN